MNVVVDARALVRLAVLATAVVAVTACGSRDVHGSEPTAGRVPTPAPAPAPPATPTAAAPPDSAATVMAADVPSLPPRVVCVEQPDGSFRSTTARASIGGLYDSSSPLRVDGLNWMALGVGCVTYPGASARTVACGTPGEPPAPVVSRTACQR